MAERMSNRLTLRPATLEDCRRVWEWRNEPATREASFNTGYIPYREHESWFPRKLSDPCTRIFIVADAQGREVGYVRFDMTGGQAEISVSIGKNERGKGHGPAAIQAASNHLLATGAVQCIIAQIRRDNPASMAAFERAGFMLRGHKQIGGVEACEMIYEGKAIAGA